MSDKLSKKTTELAKLIRFEISGAVQGFTKSYDVHRV